LKSSLYIFIILYSVAKLHAAPCPYPTDTAKSFTFAVSPVQLAVQPLMETSLSDAVQIRLGKELYAMHHDSVEHKVLPVYMNGFMQTVQYAYAQHRPLVLSPDHVWLLICQGVSIHINEHFKTLDKQVFKTERPKIITVRYDSLITGEALYWDSVVTALADSVQQYIKPEIYELMMPAFSTTGPNERIAYTTTLLEATQKAFAYAAVSGCGIPNITLTGSVQDWEKIYKNVDIFNRYGLRHWTANLKPILKQFLQARQGKVDIRFWNNLYKESSYYGVFNISGWVLKFFPYTKDYYIDTAKKEDEANETFRYVPNIYMDGEDYRMSKFNTRSFPGGYAKVNIEWMNYFQFEQKTMEIYAGFMAIEQNKQTMALSPYIAWAVCRKDAPPATDDLYRIGNENEMPHEPELWVSDLVTQAPFPPIYAPHINTDSAQGMTALARYLKKQIADALGKKVAQVKQLNLQFIVTWEGSVTNVQTSNKALDANDLDRIQLLLQNLPKPWQAAQIYNKEDADKLYKVNYKVNMVVKF